MASKTLFQKIMDGEIPGSFEHEDEQCVVIRDISPQAPVHLLVIPRKPIATLEDLQEQDGPLIGHLYLVAKRLMSGLGHRSYRTAFNCGEEAGQQVYHLHLHVLAGRPFGWPPG
jgi:histidine triad (HIT) family protein